MRKLKMVLSIIVILALFVSKSFAVTLPSVSTSGNVVNISGKLEENNTNVTLLILDKDGTRQYLDQTKTDDDGDFSFKLNLNNGNYNGKISTELNQYELKFKVEDGTSQGPDSGDSDSPSNGKGSSDNSNTYSGEQITNEVVKERKSFKDIENHWARNEIELLAAKGIVAGMENDNFKPDESITRAQFATMIFYLLELEKEEYTGKFVDVKSSDWFSPYVEAVAKAGVVLGSQGHFYPNNKITREEMAVIIVRVIELKNINTVSSQISFNDKNEISSWAVESVSKAIDKKIIKGMTDLTFEPRQNATRAQASVIVYRIMELLGSV